ncbi:Xaa-Pro peptidase family protein [Streptobacillus felis]|uniref:M24 family metallopeptidase n=1 Tax=Streptobacillus felis TaxID=1384509 RepID=UPI000836F9AE|nr:Xaa-Pro peptidase family protein [Streptobacillus felis]
MNKLEQIFEKLEIDGLLLTDYYNKRYFTGFTGSTGIALVTKKNKYFISDFRYTEQATKQVSEYGFTFIEDNARNYNKLVELAKVDGVTKLGIDNLSLSYSEFEAISEAFSFAKLIKSSNELVASRRIKTPEEIEKIRKAIKISEEALLETIPQIKEGMTEIEVAAILEYNQRKRGASGTSFDTIVASGYRSAMPHGVASEKKIEKEEFITIDYGCYYDGYASDITRTIYFGENIEPRMLEIYEKVRKSNELGIELIKAGKTGKEIDAAVREFMGDDAKYFGHSLGHSFGLEVHEVPMLSMRDETKLEAGMTVTVEPGIYVSGYAGVRIEDDIVVTENGHEVLTSLDKKLIMVYNK